MNSYLKLAVMISKPKILFWDIETSKIMALTFSLYPDRIHPADVVEDWRIHCIAYKWAGQKKVHALVEHNRSDYELVKSMREVLCEADYVVHHNGDKFDLRKFNARLVRHGLPPLPPKIKTIDTLKEVKKILQDTSHRLDCLGDYYNIGRKLENETGLWYDCFFGKKKSLNQLVKYNKQDVILLENVFNYLHKYFKVSVNYNLFTKESHNCPKCGSDQLQKRGRVINATTVKQRYQCQSCGSWSQSTKTINKTEVQ